MKRIYFLSTVFIAFLLFAGNMTALATSGGTVIQPTSTGIVWVAGNTYNITWTAVSPAQAVDVYLLDHGSFDNFTVDDRIKDNVTSTTTSVEWTIPSDQDTGEYWIFITTADDVSPIAFDGSNNSFEIASTGPGGTGTIHVNQPNVTGIQWAWGQQVGIYWDYDLGLDVKLELYVHNGGNAGNDTDYSLFSGTSGLPSSVSGSGYIWTIPNTVTEGFDYKIRVSSTTSDDEDFSDNEFAIYENPTGGTEITVIQPNGGEQWVPGTTRLISWDDDLLENVKLELVVWNSGTSEWDDYSGAPASGLPTSVAGSTYDWPIPEGLTGTNFGIRVSSTDVNSNVDPAVSESTFTLTTTPSGGTTINLIQPDIAGIQWLNEGTYLISWMDDLIEDVKIQLVTDAAGNNAVDPMYSEIPDQLFEGTTWEWTIPEAGTDPGQLDPGFYYIRVYSSQDGDVEAISEHPFEVASAPNGGTYIDLIQPNIAGIEWASGTDHLVSWMDDLLEPVSFELWYYDSTVGVEDWVEYTDEESDLPSDVEGTTFVWSIPDADDLTPGTYKIRAESSYDGAIFDLGVEFEILAYPSGGEITVFQPSDGDEWLIGGTYLVSWTDNISETVKLEYSLDANEVTPTWTEIATGIEGSTYVWNTATTAPPAAGNYTNCKIRVTSDYQPGVTNESDGYFSFLNSLGGDVEVIAPNGDEQWVVGNTYYIVWNDELVENVYIKLWDQSLDGGTGDFVDAVTAGLPSYGGAGVPGSTYEWTIPSGLDGSDFRIYIVSVLDDQYYDDSDSEFTITDEPSGGTFITVNTPNGGEVWTIGQTYTIWWDDDLIENVDIDLVDAGEEFIAEIANDVPSIGNYEWTISSALYGIGTYKVHIYSHTGGAGSIEDFSNGTFTLIEGKSPTGNFTFSSGSQTYSMYPNPVSNVLNVSSTATIDRIQIQSLVGQLVFEGDINATQATINTQEFVPGIYVVRIESAGEIETQKLIVK